MSDESREKFVSIYNSCLTLIECVETCIDSYEFELAYDLLFKANMKLHDFINEEENKLNEVR